MPPIARNSASARLLTRVVESGDATNAGLAAALGLTVAQIEDYAAQRERMPLPLQVRLAQVIEADAPRFAREARRLRAQVLAQSTMDSGITICHARPPEGWR